MGNKLARAAAVVCEGIGNGLDLPGLLFDIAAHSLLDQAQACIEL
jgi:hypothetical protein